MVEKTELSRERYNMGDICRLMGVTMQTLRNWDASGKYTFHRTSGGHRYLFRDELIEMLRREGREVSSLQSDRHDVIYCRIPPGADESLLDFEASCLLAHYPNLQEPMLVREQAQGGNLCRESLLKLLDQVQEGKIRQVCVLHPDIPAGKNLKFLEKVFAGSGTAIVCPQRKELSKPEQKKYDLLSSLLLQEEAVLQSCAKPAD